MQKKHWMNENPGSTKRNNSGSGTKPLAPRKDSKRSLRIKNRQFVSLEVSSRKHRRAKGRIYAKTDGSHKQKGKIDYH